MKGGQTREIAQRWRRLAEPDPRVLSMADVVRIFLRLREGAEGNWQEALEGFPMQTSPYAEEIRVQREIQVLRRTTVEVLEARFPNAVPSALVKRIKEASDLEKLRQWPRLAATLPLDEFPERIG